MHVDMLLLTVHDLCAMTNCNACIDILIVPYIYNCSYFSGQGSYYSLPIYIYQHVFANTDNHIFHPHMALSIEFAGVDADTAQEVCIINPIDCRCITVVAHTQTEIPLVRAKGQFPITLTMLYMQTLCCNLCFQQFASCSTTIV